MTKLQCTAYCILWMWNVCMEHTGVQCEHRTEYIYLRYARIIVVIRHGDSKLHDTVSHFQSFACYPFHIHCKQMFVFSIGVRHPWIHRYVYTIRWWFFFSFFCKCNSLTRTNFFHSQFKKWHAMNVQYALRTWDAT